MSETWESDKNPEHQTEDGEAPGGAAGAFSCCEGPKVIKENSLWEEMQCSVKTQFL